VKIIASKYYNLTEDALIQACKKRNLNAQRELYIRFKDVLFVLCLKYCKNTVEAEDNLQDSFLDIYKNIKKYKHSGSFEGWMKRITINNALNKYKKDRFINVMVNEEITEDITIDPSEINLPLNTILNTIQELPNRYRLVFNLYQLDNYSHKEIAKLLDISEGTSKSNFHRAKIILKEKLQTINKSQSSKTHHGQ
jgi:RNA polymerase sigma-70 factor (ECF subfamily)